MTLHSRHKIHAVCLPRDALRAKLCHRRTILETQVCPTEMQLVSTSPLVAPLSYARRDGSLTPQALPCVLHGTWGRRVTSALSKRAAEAALSRKLGLLAEVVRVNAAITRSKASRSAVPIAAAAPAAPPKTGTHEEATAMEEASPMEEEGMTMDKESPMEEGTPMDEAALMDEVSMMEAARPHGREATHTEATATHSKAAAAHTKAPPAHSKATAAAPHGEAPAATTKTTSN